MAASRERSSKKSSMERSAETKPVKKSAKKSTGKRKREAFGHRHLTGEQDVFQFNAW